MKNLTRIFGLLSDETRVRILMLLSRKELCVCQMMGVLGISQPLISRNLTLLSDAGFLNERRDGKLIFYSSRRDASPLVSKILEILKAHLKNDSTFNRDLMSLMDCYEFQKKTGKCDMKTFLKFMEQKRKKRGR